MTFNHRGVALMGRGVVREIKMNEVCLWALWASQEGGREGGRGMTNMAASRRCYSQML